jgi:hypothetical protein
MVTDDIIGILEVALTAINFDGWRSPPCRLGSMDLFYPFLKELQPPQHDGVMDRVRLAAFLRRLAPVESDPTRGSLL